MHALRAAVAFDGERFLAGGATVVVDGSRIAGVEAYDADLPADVEVTSYDGTLLPGLIDAHVHLVADGTIGSLERTAVMADGEIDDVVARTLAQQVAAGVTTVRDLGDRRYRTLGFRDSGAPGVPRIVAAGPPFTIPDGHCHYLGGAAVGREAIETAMAEHVERGVDVVKVMASRGMLTPGSDQLGVQFSPEDLRSIVDLAHAAGLQVLAHTHSLRGAWHAFGAIDTPDDLLDAVAAARITVDPTLGWNPALMVSPENMPPALRALIDRLGPDPVSMRATHGEQMLRARDRGIRVISGIDAGVGPAKGHGNVWRSVAELVGAGFTPVEALATATSAAADACGLSDTTGRLRPGLEADLLVVDGDPGTDPTALGRPVAVVVRGTATTSRHSVESTTHQAGSGLWWGSGDAELVASGSSITTWPRSSP